MRRRMKTNKYHFSAASKQKHGFQKESIVHKDNIPTIGTLFYILF